MTTETPAPLERAIDVAGGQKQLAELVGTSQSMVWYWLTKKKGRVPAEFAIPIEEATGVPRHELRPDLFQRRDTSPAARRRAS